LKAPVLLRGSSRSSSSSSSSSGRLRSSSTRRSRPSPAAPSSPRSRSHCRTLGNLFAGIALALEDSFEVGDVIRSGDHIGIVEAVRWRGTRLRTFQNHVVIVPDSMPACAPRSSAPQPERACCRSASTTTWRRRSR
jgi:hypothetical protein